jgi:tRNA(His) 5'-end guanylyltransferase
MGIGERMKENYENRYRIKLTRRTPVIIRLDGKAFHSLKLEKPFDPYFGNTMQETAIFLCANIQGAKLAYTQSDEISILVSDCDYLKTEAWFDYNLQKVVSISAALASAYFNAYYRSLLAFDSRAFNLPKEEVCNYFIWRQQDWIRNSVHMLARAHYSHKELHNKNSSDMHEMLHKKGVNWANLANRWKNGAAIKLGYPTAGWVIWDDLIFSKQREIVETLLVPKEE